MTRGAGGRCGVRAPAATECLLLDGGVGSEIVRTGDPWAIYDHTQAVFDVHRRYALAGCDVISTNTWGLLGSTATDRGRRPGRTGLPAWTVATRDAVSLARQAIAEAGRSSECAVAFSLNDADPLLVGERGLLRLLWSVEPPDLVLVETLAAIPSPPLMSAIAEVAASGMPVWVSFRRVGAWPGEPPGAFSSAVRDLEDVGVAAVLVNCIPVERATGALAELVALTSLPVGCYPRLDAPLEPAAYGELAREWRRTGARIVGGCCGVGPQHIDALRRRLQPGEAASDAGPGHEILTLRGGPLQC